MGQESSIQWTEATWNPWHGCKKVSAGCKYCYMYRDKIKFGQDPFKVVRSKGKFFEPLKWKEPKVIFTCSWSDWFIDEADEWRNEAWKVIKDTPHHTYQILTKRPERIKEHLPDDWGNGYSNVWLGTSIESDNFKSRLHDLHSIKTDKSLFKTFISYEPALGYLDLSNDDMLTSYEFDRLDWLIVGGESGNDNGEYKYRECKLEWIEEIVSQCKEKKVPVFVKQMGTYLSKQMAMSDRHGGNIDDFPKHLQIREMPTTNKVINTY